MRSIATLLLTFQCVAGCTDRSATTSTTAVPEAARPRTGITIRVVDLLNVDIRDVPLLMAFDELAAHGYLIEKAYLGSGALVTDTLARGDADVAIVNNQTAWTALTKGADIRTIAEFTSPTYVLAVSPTIQSCHDLGGRKVGVPTTSGLPGMFLPLYMHRHCPGTTPQMLIILESSARNAALMSGVVDAVIVPAEGLIKVQRQSSAAFHALMSFASEFPGVQMDGLHVRRDWAEQHRELVLDLLRAQLRAQRLVTDSPDVLYQQAMKRLSLDADTAKAIGDAHLQMGIWDLNGGLTPGSVQATIDFLVGEKAAPAGMKATDVADFSYLDAVLREMGHRQPTPPRERSRPSP